MYISHANASVFRIKAAIIKNTRLLEDSDEVVRLEAQASLAEIESMSEVTQHAYQATLDEIAYIKKCINEIEPKRKYRHLPLAEAHEIAQRDEWKLELIYRAENFLLTSGTIPSDHLATMRQHPDFISDIVPAIEQIKQDVSNGQLTLLGLELNRTKFLQAK